MSRTKQVGNVRKSGEIPNMDQVTHLPCEVVYESSEENSERITAGNENTDQATSTTNELIRDDIKAILQDKEFIKFFGIFNAMNKEQRELFLQRYEEDSESGASSKLSSVFKYGGMVGGLATSSLLHGASSTKEENGTSVRGIDEAAAHTRTGAAAFNTIGDAVSFGKSAASIDKKRKYAEIMDGAGGVSASAKWKMGGSTLGLLGSTLGLGAAATGSAAADGKGEGLKEDFSKVSVASRAVGLAGGMSNLIGTGLENSAHTKTERAYFSRSREKIKSLLTAAITAQEDTKDINDVIFFVRKNTSPQKLVPKMNKLVKENANNTSIKQAQTINQSMAITETKHDSGHVNFASDTISAGINATRLAFSSMALDGPLSKTLSTLSAGLGIINTGISFAKAMYNNYKAKKVETIKDEGGDSKIKEIAEPMIELVQLPEGEEPIDLMNKPEHITTLDTYMDVYSSMKMRGVDILQFMWKAKNDPLSIPTATPADT